MKEIHRLYHIETAWSSPWLVVRASQQGASHFQNGGHYEDAAAFGLTAGVLWMVVADGVGSRPYGREGSRVAVEAVARRVDLGLSAGAAPDVSLLAAAFEVAHGALASVAKAKSENIADYATTLSAVLIGPERIVAASIGDSSVAAYVEHEESGKAVRRLLPIASAPQPRDGSTYSIVQRNHAAVTGTATVLADPVVAVVCATDGANDLFLSPDGHRQQRFDTTYLAALENAVGQLGLPLIGNFFAGILGKRAQSDDRTLLLAYRLPKNLQPPGPPA